MRANLRAALLYALAALAAIAISQGENGLAKKPKAQTPAASNGPLLLSELYATTERVESGIRRVVLASSLTPMPRKLSADRPAKRTEIIAEFHRLFALAKANFKFTPRAVRYEAKLITVPAADPVRKPLETLIQYGFVGRVAPLPTSDKPTMELVDYGDALGFFVARLGDLTHTPSAKWSPYMFNHRDLPSAGGR